MTFKCQISRTDNYNTPMDEFPPWDRQARRISVQEIFSSSSTASMSSLKKFSMSFWNLPSRSITSKLRIIIPIMSALACWCIMIAEVSHNHR